MLSDSKEYLHLPNRDQSSINQQLFGVVKSTRAKIHSLESTLAHQGLEQSFLKVCSKLTRHYLKSPTLSTVRPPLTPTGTSSHIAAEARVNYSSNNPSQRGLDWSNALFTLLDSLPNDVKSRAASLAIDGTSATTLLLDAATGDLLADPKLYDEGQNARIVQLAASIAPKDHTATASTSTLCKVMTWDDEGRWQAAAEEGREPVILHQADWLAFLLHGNIRTTDYNNALKLGYDPGEERYPGWLLDQKFAPLLPTTVVAPGMPVAPVTPRIASKTGLSPTTMICAGTTDSIAAFIAGGLDLNDSGAAVTSLGSTMAIKLLSDSRVDNARYGIYSHRLGAAWLVGGASNTGGAVLRSFFTDDQMAQLTKQLQPDIETGLDYIPLLKPGERFPINDPGLQPRLTPRPDSDVKFFQGILEAIAASEARAYELLAELGASPVKKVLTAGGGSKNAKWMEIRSRMLGGVPVEVSPQGEAAYGAAVLARQGYVQWRKRGEGGEKDWKCADNTLKSM